MKIIFIASIDNMQICSVDKEPRTLKNADIYFYVQHIIDIQIVLDIT